VCRCKHAPEQLHGMHAVTPRCPGAHLMLVGRLCCSWLCGLQCQCCQHSLQRLQRQLLAAAQQQCEALQAAQRQRVGCRNGLHDSLHCLQLKHGSLSRAVIARQTCAWWSEMHVSTRLPLTSQRGTMCLSTSTSHGHKASTAHVAYDCAGLAEQLVQDRCKCCVREPGPGPWPVTHLQTGCPCLPEAAA
jgi:hypothetical protein